MSLSRSELVQRSLEVILENQHEGAFLACPVMPDYQFSWFRDGAYIAYALTVDGARRSAQYAGSMAAQWESAYRFFSWGANQINQRHDRLQNAIAEAQAGKKPSPQNLLNARYRVDGMEGPEEWPEFQLDGAGTWLWAMAKYIRITGFTPLAIEWERAVRIVSAYLAALWQFPCYDCWEERGDDIHSSTLAAIYAGLKAAQELVPEIDYNDTMTAIRTFLLEECLTPNGELAKSKGLDMLDANLMTCSLPHQILEIDHPIMQKTFARIERELVAKNGGVHRHLEDTYYGGGAWVLLDLWRAWYFVASGEREKALKIVEWVESTADEEGNLAEQVNTSMLDSKFYEPWVKERGEIAQPLLWTHAMYILLCHRLELL